MNNLIYSFLILVLLFGCKQQDREKNSLLKFEYNLRKSLMMAIEVKKIAPSHSIIDRPPLVNREILTFIDALGNKYEINYTVASLKTGDLGVLNLILKQKENDHFLTSLSGIEQLQYELNKELVLLFKKNKMNHSMKIPLLNLDSPKKKISLTSSSNKRYFDGLFVSVGKELPLPTMISYKNDSYPDKESKVCHQISDSCEELSPNNCGACEWGSYSVIGKYSCEKGMRKYCGVNRCGQKGWPACQRFALPDPVNKEVICYDNSPLGFCNEGLEVYCVNNELICL